MKKILKLFVVIFCLICINFGAEASWTSFRLGNYHGMVLDIKFVNTTTGFAVGFGGTIFKTTDGGMAWNQISTNIVDNFMKIRFASSTVMYIGAGGQTGGVIYRSSNGGNNWTIVGSAQINDLYVLSALDVIVVGDNGYLRRTTNGGVNWINLSPSGASHFARIMFSPSGKGFISGGYNYNNPFHMYVSTDNGYNWSADPSVGYTFQDIEFNGTVGFAVFGPGIYNKRALIYRTTNDGIVWTTQSVDTCYLGSISFANAYTGFAAGYRTLNSGTDIGYVYKTIDNGISWDTELVNSTKMYTVDCTPTSAFIGCDSGMVIRDDFTIGIQTISHEVPKLFSLNQNYPNPFNPSTNIKFDIVKSGKVSLTVFDILGRTVETLFSQELSVGTYSADWDASKYSSGIYFYKLESKDFVETKKMIFIK